METFFLAGGDARQHYLSRLLEENGYEVIRSNPSSSSWSLKESMEAADVILCPVPFTKNGTHIFSVHEPEQLKIDDLLTFLRKGHTLFGGNIPKQAADHCSLNRIPFHDFMKMEEVTLKNTAATAEGALAEAIRLSRGLLHHSRCLVLGFGRCGQTLGQKLKGLEARTVIADRKACRLAQAWSQGFDVLFLEDIKKEIHTFDYIFNTIPAPVLGPSAIAKLKENTVVIDIASAPGGVDFDACRQAGITARLCPGLPGIYAPRASAEILYEAVMECLSSAGSLKKGV